MKNLGSLFFELSSEDRLRILYQLRREANNVTHVSNRLDITVQESSRHLSRLSDIGLTERNSEGLYHLTFYGKLVLKQIEGLTFTSKHRKYFAIHSLEHLPSEFIDRIGDLTGSTCIDDISDAFYRVDRIVREAEEYIYTITDQYLMSTYPFFKEALEQGVKLRNIEGRDWVVSHQIREEYFSDLDQWVAIRQAFERARTTRLIEERVVERLDVFLYMSEKEVAAVAFPLSNGKFDYLGFAATDDKAHKWCNDLFQHYWERARSRQGIVEELYRWIKKKPEAVHILKRIAEAKEIKHKKGMISQLESKGLTRQGNLTVLGVSVYKKIQQ